MDLTNADSASKVPEVPTITIDQVPSNESERGFSESVARSGGSQYLGPPEIVTSAPPSDDQSPGEGLSVSTGNLIGRRTPNGESNETDRGRQAHRDLRIQNRRHSVHSDIRQIPSLTVEKTNPSPSLPKHEDPRPDRLQIIDKTPKGWRIKTRTVYSPRPISRHSVDIFFVYIYSSAACQGLGEDADMALFGYQDVPGYTPTPGIQRARTAQIPDTKRTLLPSFAAPYAVDETLFPPRDKRKLRSQLQGTPQDSSLKATSEAKPIEHGSKFNWLSSSNMLPKHFPGARVMTVGFDLDGTLNAPLNFETASTQLTEYLHDIRKDSPEKPILFLAHSYGGIFVIQTLSNVAKQDSPSHRIIQQTAGLFLFSCTYLSSPNSTNFVAHLLSYKPSARLFADMSSGMPTLVDLAQTFKSRVFNQQPRKKGTSTTLQIGFPIMQFIARDEHPEERYFNMVSESFLQLPQPTVSLGRNYQDAIRFPNHEDPDFSRVMLFMQSGLRTHQFLHTVESGNCTEVRRMILNGLASIMMRDRWNQSALIVAVQKDDEAMVRLLLRVSKAEPNVHDKKFNTALHYAIRNGNVSIVLDLLEHGADINFENHRKQTPKDLANKRSSRKRISEILKSQLVEGPDETSSTARLSDGSPPISMDGRLACKNYQIVVTEIFESASTDRHWTVSVSVQELIYSSSTLEEILQTVRPESVRGQSPFCIWIHIPVNNMVWVEDLFIKLHAHQAIWHGKRGLTSEALRNRTIAPHVSKGKINSIFVPYISYENNARQARRNEFISAIDEENSQESSTRRIIEQYISRPSMYSGANLSPASSDPSNHLLQVPEMEIAEAYMPQRRELDDPDSSTDEDSFDPDGLDEEEKALVKTYLHKPASLHIRRTLDQYYYHMIESTSERDGDQVVSRWARNIKKEFTHNVLMVDQLWLWTAPGGVNDSDQQGIFQREQQTMRKLDYVISCFPSRTGTGHSTERLVGDLRHSVLLPHQKRRDPICQTEEVVSRILETCFNSFDKLHSSELLRFFNIFESSIGTVNDKQTRLFQSFQRGSEKRHELDKANKYYQQRKQELFEQLFDIREDTRLLVEIKDIQDEINIILSVLDTQNTIVKQLRAAKGDTHDLLSNSTVETLVEANINDFGRLNNQAKTVQDNLNTLMDLKQKAANAWEAREAREYALEAGRQGNTMVVFTTVTIIFLPLSFLASFFALDVASFPKDPDSGQTNWPLSVVASFVFGISFGIWIPLSIMAFKMEKITHLWGDIRHDHLIKIALRFRGFPLSRSCDQWFQELEQDRNTYLKDLALDERLEKSILDERDSDDLRSTVSSSFLIGPDKSAHNDGEFSRLGQRLQMQRARYRMRRKHRDEETLPETEDN